MPSERLLVINLNDVRAIRVECLNCHATTITQLNAETVTMSRMKQCACPKDWDEGGLETPESIANQLFIDLRKLRGGKMPFRIQFEFPDGAIASLSP